LILVLLDSLGCVVNVSPWQSGSISMMSHYEKH
jgi:hypothetical protein